MLQVAAPIWNRIAEYGLATPFGEKFLTLNQQQMTDAQQLEYDRLTKAGTSPEAAISFLTLAPLLLERKAISRYARSNPQIRDALPEVTSVQEALHMAIAGDRLNPKQTAELRTLLEEAQSARMTA